MQSRTTITSILMACDRFLFDLTALNTVHDEITVSYSKADAKATAKLSRVLQKIRFRVDADPG